MASAVGVRDRGRDPAAAALSAQGPMLSTAGDVSQTPPRTARSPTPRLPPSLRPAAAPQPPGEGGKPLLGAGFVLHVALQPLRCGGVTRPAGPPPAPDVLAQSRHPSPAPGAGVHQEACPSGARAGRGVQPHLPYLAAVDSDHWLEAEMSSSGMWPPDMPRG